MGCPPDLYSTCILVAGGSGVSYTLSLFLNLIRENARGKSAVRRILFVWALRDENYLSWFSKTLTEALLHAKSSLDISLRVYLTSPSTKTSSSSASTASEKGYCSRVKTTTMISPIKYHPSLKLIHGRPDHRRVLHDEISASTAEGSISVDVAGPAGLTPAVRRALCSDVAAPRAVLKGLPAVTLHVKTFSVPT